MGWTRLQRVAAQTTTTANSLAVNISSSGAGNLLLVYIWANTVINTPTDGSTTYQQDVAVIADNHEKIYSGVNLSGGITTVTAHFSGLSNAIVVVEEWSGNATTNWFDQGLTNTAATAGWTSNATASLAQTGELAVGVCIETLNATMTNTPSGGFGDGGVGRNTTDGDSLFVENQVLATTTGIAATGTLSAGTSWNALVATYKPLGGSSGPSLFAASSQGAPQVVHTSKTLVY